MEMIDRRDPRHAKIHSILALRRQSVGARTRPKSVLNSQVHSAAVIGKFVQPQVSPGRLEPAPHYIRRVGLYCTSGRLESIFFPP